LPFSILKNDLENTKTTQKEMQFKFINRTNRNQLQLFASSIDDAIAQDNEI
jgi:hypothetical protein